VIAMLIESDNIEDRGMWIHFFVSLQSLGPEQCESVCLET